MTATGYMTDLITARSLKFIADRAAQWFLLLSLIAAAATAAVSTGCSVER